MDRKFECAYLHFGADKTGSTAIQTALHAFRGLIRSSGIVAYPPGFWHPQLGSAFSEQPERYVFNELSGLTDPQHIRLVDRQYLDELTSWLDACRPCQSLVFSYEGFPTLDAKAMRGMREFCLGYAHRVKVIMYVRPPLSYAVSAMSQRVKQGFPPWPKDDPPISPHKAYLSQMLLAFQREEIDVRLFSRKALRNSDVLIDFLHAIQVDDDLAVRIAAGYAQENESLSGNAIRIGESLVASLSEHGIAISSSDFHQKYGQYLGAIPGDRVTLSPEQSDLIAEASRVHSEFVLENFGISLIEDIRITSSERKAEPEGLVPIDAVSSLLFAIVQHDRDVCPDFSTEYASISRAYVLGKTTVEFSGKVIVAIELSLAEGIRNPKIELEVSDHNGQCCFAEEFELAADLYGQSGGNNLFAMFGLTANIPDGNYNIALRIFAQTDEKFTEVAKQRRSCSFNVATPRSPRERGYSHIPISSAFHRIEHGGTESFSTAVGSISTQKPVARFLAGERFELPVLLRNNSQKTWMSHPDSPLNLTWEWSDVSGSRTIFPQSGSLTLPSLDAGQELETIVPVIAPDVPGMYTLSIRLSQPGPMRFDSDFFESLTTAVCVCAGCEPHIFSGYDTRLQTKIGKRIDGIIASGGDAGFLVYGPYLRLESGRYIARISFSCSTGHAGAWADVCSAQGMSKHARHEVSLRDTQKGELRLPFFLESRTENIEVRVWVPTGSDFQLNEIAVLKSEPGKDS